MVLHLTINPVPKFEDNLFTESKFTHFPMFKLGAMNQKAKQLWSEGYTTEEAIQRIFNESSGRAVSYLG